MSRGGQHEWLRLGVVLARCSVRVRLPDWHRLRWFLRPVPAVQGVLLAMFEFGRHSPQVDAVPAADRAQRCRMQIAVRLITAPHCRHDCRLRHPSRLPFSPFTRSAVL